jgi:hypothetical protein
MEQTATLDRPAATETVAAPEIINDDVGTLAIELMKSEAKWKPIRHAWAEEFHERCYAAAIVRANDWRTMFGHPTLLITNVLPNCAPIYSLSDRLNGRN